MFQSSYTTKEEIENLVAAQIGESKILDFKRSIPDQKSDRSEFINDICAFANTEGGHLIIGIDEKRKDGKRTGEFELAPIPASEHNRDSLILSLESQIRDGIAPRLPVTITPVSGWGDDGRDFVLVVHIPQSFSAPHMANKNSCFFARNSAGKYSLDAPQIRNAFLANNAYAEQIRTYRLQRLSEIMGQSFYEHKEHFVLVVHLIPFSTFLNNARLPISEEIAKKYFLPMWKNRMYSWNVKYNMDGIRVVVTSGEAVWKYCQLNFNGAVESVMAETIFYDQGSNRDLPGVIPFQNIKNNMVEAVKLYLSGMKLLDISPPAAIMMSLYDISGTLLTNWRDLDQFRFRNAHRERIKENRIIFPDVVLNSFEEDIEAALKIPFDMLWNAYGYAKCPSPDD